ncbi:MAG: hypothetical protein AABM32_06315 [Chloroflexota bacterium]
MARAKSILFRLSAVALLLFMAVLPFSLLGLLAPWFLAGNAAPGNTPELHRWHGAQFGLRAVLIGGALIALLFRPASRPGLVQFLVAAEVIDLLGTMLFPTRDSTQNPVFFFGTIIFLVILVATYPDRRALRRIRSEEPLSPLPIALTAFLALPLIYDIYQNLSWHIAGAADEHLYWGHWMNAVHANLHLITAGILISLHVPGWRVLSLVTGVALIALGAGAIATPSQQGSWGLIGGGFAVLGGLCYLALAVIDRYRRRGQMPLRQGAAV